MNLNRRSDLNIVYDDGDHKYKEIVRKFIRVLREKTILWGFNCTEEIPGRTWLQQLQENLDSSSVTIVVILPNHDDRQDKAQYAAQSALLKAIQNKEKYLIPVCLMGGKSQDFDSLIPLKFSTEEDWKNEGLWGKLKGILEERCPPVSKKHPDTPCPSVGEATVSSTTPDSIPDILTDMFFLEISAKIVTVWWKLGIRMGLTSNVICEIEKNSPGDVCNRALAMLKRWKQSSHIDSEHEQIVIFCQALRAEKQNDLLNDIHDRYTDFSKASAQIQIKSSETNRSIDNDIFLLELAARLPEWNGFFTLLDVSCDELEILKQDYPQDTTRGAFQALVLWRSECGNEAKLDKLIGVLQMKGRQDLIDWIKDTPMSQGIQQMSSDILTDRFFLETSAKIVTVWWKLGIRMGLTSNVICEIEKNSPGDVSGRALKMLKRWKQSSNTDSEQEQIVIFCQALKVEKQNDLLNDIQNSNADFSKASAQIQIKSSETDKSIDNDIFLLELAARLPEWNGFFTLLNVSCDELEILKQDYPQDTIRGAFQALVLWRSECGNEANMDKLIGVLQMKGRQDLIDWIKDTPMSQGIQQMSSEDWKTFFNANREEAAQQLINSDIKLDKSTLDFACNKLGRRSEAIKVVCKRICDDFNRQTGVKHTWPAYTYEKGDASFGGKITFVVLTDKAFDDEGYTCHFRNVDKIDDRCKVENKKIKEREQQDLMLIRELDDVQRCIDVNSKAFKTNHKYCWRITASPFKSTGYKTDNPDNHSIKKIKCIALYVPFKGFIPLDEEPFPATIGEFPVDVREGNIVKVF